MQIAVVLAVVATLFFAESGPAAPLAGQVGVRLAMVVLASAMVPGVAAAISKFVARQIRRYAAGAADASHDDGPSLALADPMAVCRLQRAYRRLRGFHVLLWLAVVVIVVQGLEWPRIVRFNWRLAQVPLVDELLILLPVLLPLILSWVAFYEVDRAGAGGRAVGGIAETKSTPAPFATRRAYLDLHMRHYLAMVLLPVVGLLAVQDVLGLVLPNGLKDSAVPVVLVGTMVLLMAIFPILLRRVWRTRPLPAGTLRSRLEAMARANGQRLGEILIWETGSMVVNAAVTGFTRRWRYVFLSDGLLELLTEDQVVAVFGHELGHVRHQHLWLRAAAMLVPLSLGMYVLYALPGPIGALGDYLRRSGLDAAGSPLGLLALAAMIAYVLTVFGFYSRCLEHEADLSTCRYFPPDMGVPMLCSALERLAVVHGNRGSRGWQHASIARRVDFLKSVDREPKLGLRFDRRVRLLGGIVIALSLSPLICLLLCFCLLG